MKRFICFALACIIVIMFGACTKADEYSLETGMRQMEKYFASQENIVEVDVVTFSSFCDSFNSTKFRLRGMVTESKSLTNGFTGSNYISFCLITDGMSVSVFLEDGEIVRDGEYVEVVGNLLQFGNESEKRAGCSIHNATVVERGSSVRERIEDPK